MYDRFSRAKDSLLEAVDIVITETKERKNPPAIILKKEFFTFPPFPKLCVLEHMEQNHTIPLPLVTHFTPHK